ncbi:MAG: hypothetical protein KY466_00725 [Gemmatimonadetes bacterium]|nr:hypothetical protein [Gemmatimonadota bacterium]
MKRATLTAVLAVLLAGCGGGGPDVGTVRDSAGVTIVEHAPEAVERVERWTAGPEPLLDIGVTEGDAAYQFFRLQDALWLGDGRVVVLDAGARQLRLFDPAGSFLTAHGREGEGPGEYRDPRAIWRAPGDSLAVYDARNRRVTVLSDRLAFGRSVPFHARIYNEEPAGALEDGRLVVTARSGRAEGGIAPISLWLVGAREPGADSVARFPGNETDGRAWPIYGWRTVASAGEDRIYVGTSREHEVEEHGLVDGGGLALRRLIRWSGPDRTVSEEDREAYFRGYAERTRTPPEGEAALRQALADVPVAEEKPAYVDLMVDAAGNLWVMDYDFPWRAIPEQTRWTVFGPHGGMLARATLPARFRPYEIGEDRVLGQRFDGDGVQHVTVLELRKEEAR